MKVGQMGSKQEMTTVGEFAPFTYGKGLPAGKRNLSGHFAVFGSNGIVGWHDTALTDGPTVVIGRKGTVGAVHYWPDPCWPIDTTYYTTGSDADLVRYRYYALGALGLADMNTHSAVPGLNRDDAHSLDLPLPSLWVQRRIAQILGALDDKIDLNQRMNETLEQMARALYKSWFVDFDPVRAKMDGRWHRGKSLSGLPAELYDLFPDHLVTSELGEIPDGWTVGVLANMVQLFSGGTPKTSVAEYWNGNIPWYTAKDAPALSDVFAIDTERHISQSGVDNSATQVLPARTTIISARGTVGRLACLGEPMAMNQTCYGIRGIDKYPDWFTYWNVRQAISELKMRTHGTIFDTITRQTFELVDAVVPPPVLAAIFETMVSPYMSRMLASLRDSRRVAYLRDALLPRLVSGKLRVAEPNVTEPV